MKVYKSGNGTKRLGTSVLEKALTLTFYSETFCSCAFHLLKINNISNRFTNWNHNSYFSMRYFINFFC